MIIIQYAGLGSFLIGMLLFWFFSEGPGEDLIDDLLNKRRRMRHSSPKQQEPPAPVTGLVGDDGKQLNVKEAAEMMRKK